MGMLNFWNISLLLCFHLFLFLGYVWCLIQDSTCDFTAYAHTTVSMLSAKYNHNERWYNYTTPKSFLEQIILYKILLKRKNKMSGHVEHLVNGMEKLKAAAFQVNCESHNPFFHFLYVILVLLLIKQSCHSTFSLDCLVAFLCFIEMT